LIPFQQEDYYNYLLCMLDGPGSEKQEQPSSGKRSKSAVPSPRGKGTGEPSEGLVKTVKQLQSDVDKLKYAEHKKRELSRVVKERQKAEEELRSWLTGGTSSRRSTPNARERYREVCDADVQGDTVC